VNALRVLHQIQNFLSIGTHQNVPAVVFVLRDDLEPLFFRQFSKVLVSALQELRSFRSLYTDEPQVVDLDNCAKKLSSFFPVYVSSRPSRPGIYLITNRDRLATVPILQTQNIVNLVQLDRCVREAQRSHPTQSNIQNTEEFLYRLLQLWSFSTNYVENSSSHHGSESLETARPSVAALTITFKENSEILRALDSLEHLYDLPESSSESTTSDLINFEMFDPHSFPDPPTSAELAALETRNSSFVPRSGVAPLDSVPSRFSGGRPDNDAPYKPRLPLPLFKNAVQPTFS